MIPIENPIVPKEIKELLEYLETAFNFAVVAYPSHIGDENPITAFFVTYPDIQRRTRLDTGFWGHYAYEFQTGLKTFLIGTKPENVKDSLKNIIRIFSGSVLTPPVIYEKNRTSIPIPKFSSLVELKMKLQLKERT